MASLTLKIWQRWWKRRKRKRRGRGRREERVEVEGKEDGEAVDRGENGVRGRE